MTTIGNIGVGLFILIIIWILALLVFVFAVKTQSNLGWISLGTALLVTIILVVIPTEKKNQAEEEDIGISVCKNIFLLMLQNNNALLLQEKDYAYIGRICLLTFLLLSVLIGFISFFILHCVVPVRAHSIKAFYTKNVF